MVRHHFAASPAQNCVRAISAAAGRMGETAVPARLIPPGNIPTALGTGDTRTTFSTINLPAVAASADQHLTPTTLAQKEASGIMLICSMAVVMTWTRSPVCAIITRHSCSARCRARRRVELAVQSALCLPSSIFTKITARAASAPVLTPSPETPPVYFSTRWPEYPHFSTTVHTSGRYMLNLIIGGRVHDPEAALPRLPFPRSRGQGG